MIVKQVRAGEFGCLKDWQSPLLDNLVVFFGQNEAGKSTLLRLIGTLFYGWNPASRDNNPFIPWETEQASCEGLLLNIRGEELAVHRRLRSRPEGSVTLKGKSIDLGNRSLPELDFLAPEIFFEVYALDMNRLRFPDSTTWQTVEDQLLGGQYTSFLRSVRLVAEELEGEANSIWRADRRGNPRAKELRRIIADLQQRRRLSEQNEAELYQKQRNLHDHQAERKRLAEQKEGIAAKLQRMEKLYPVRRKLERIMELTTRAGDVGRYGHLPPNPEQALHNLNEDIKQHTAERETLSARKKELEKDIKALTPEDAAIYLHGEQIRSLNRSYEQLESDSKVMREGQAEILRLEGRLIDRGRGLLDGGWQDGYAPLVRNINDTELMAALKAFKKAETQSNELMARQAALRAGLGNHKGSRMPILLGTILTLIGLTGFVLGEIIPDIAAGILIFVGLGSLFWGLFFKPNRELLGELKAIEKELALINVETDVSRQAVEKSLNGLPVLSEFLEAPEGNLIVNVTRMMDLVRSVEEAQTRQRQAGARLEDAEKMVQEILEKCGLQSGNSLLENIDLLEERLSEAIQLVNAARYAREKLPETEERLRVIVSRISASNMEGQQLIAEMSSLEGGGLQEKNHCLLERRRFRDQARLLQQELEHEHSDLDRVKAEIKEAETRNEQWVNDPAEIDRVRAERDKIEEQLNKLNQLIGALEKDLEYGQQRERLDDIVGEINSLEAEMKQLCHHRDRLMLLKNVLLEADRRYREENQPDVLLQAGGYLAGITGGRYTRLLVKDTSQRGLLVKQASRGYPLEVDRGLSRGTVEQVYLSLRLALVDHLDKDKEQLPLFWDEVFVNWDGRRLTNWLRLVKEISTRRQVFFFTCHRWFAEQLMGTGAQLVEI